MVLSSFLVKESCETVILGTNRLNTLHRPGTIDVWFVSWGARDLPARQWYARRVQGDQPYKMTQVVDGLREEFVVLQLEHDSSIVS